jgi:predicted GNAT family N-acyltransferase
MFIISRKSPFDVLHQNETNDSELNLENLIQLLKLKVEVLLVKQTQLN